MRGLLALAFFTQAISAQISYDLVIRNAHILDGAGNAWFAGDVAVRGDTIAAVGRVSQVSSKWTLDAKGLTLAPGFIDTHSHGIQGIQQTPAAENLIRQGVTTIIEGPDGHSPLPIGPFLTKLAQRPIGVNFGLLVGHNSIRQRVMGTENRRATPSELEAMRGLARQAMIEGAFGLSTGLFYVPGNYASTEEVIELAKVIGSQGGLHTSHMRSEADHVVESVNETIRIGEEGHLPTQVTHHKIIGVSNWGKSVETLQLIHDARARGVDVTLDAYPYTASSTGLGASLVPQWARAGGSKALRERAASPETGRKLRAEMRANMNDTRGGPAKLTLASCGFDRSLAGKTLAEAAGSGDPVEVALDFVLRGDCSVVSHSISEEDIERILRDPLTMIASDGGIPSFGSDVPHPRNYATFARVLARYVRERHTLTLEDAVRKMSGLPAQRFGLPDRGLIRPGMKADLVLFDSGAIAENSTFEKPHQYATGVSYVWVNGVCELKEGRMTGALGGRPLYGPARAGGTLP
ncbi:MAG TPA: D-aminoacylase [Paludibaculum sp.]|jgi:dihydroorotase/N-acyl-D-amino-acid deacylase